MSFNIVKGFVLTLWDYHEFETSQVEKLRDV